MPAAEAVGKCSKIRHIVRLCQMLLWWRRKAHLLAVSRAPADVPEGHLAVCVGAARRRFVVPAVHLNHPVFQSLLVEAEEEYGFANRGGPLAIPCDEALFEEVLELVLRPGSVRGRPVDTDDLHRCCKGNGLDIRIESRPLLHGLVGKTAWRRVSTTDRAQRA